MDNLKIAVAGLGGALLLAGCATQDYVDKHVGSVQGQVTDMQGQLRAHDAHLSQLDQTTREAMERAEAAGKLAEGKFLYSMVLSDDSVKFLPDSSDLSQEAQTRLMDFVEKLKSDNRNVYLEIQGHTDATGSKSTPSSDLARSATTSRRRGRRRRHCRRPTTAHDAIGEIRGHALR